MSVNFDPTSKIKVRLGLQPNGPVQMFLTDACAKAMDKYVPFDTGTLAETVVLKSGRINRFNVTADTITYNQAYAKVVYYGERNGKPITLHKDKHRFATPYWDKEMWSAEGSDIVKQVQDFIDRGGKR